MDKSMSSKSNADENHLFGASSQAMDDSNGVQLWAVQGHSMLPLIPNCNPDEKIEPPSTSNTIKRSSRFRGVSRHRWTGRFEAHLWDKGSWNATQKKKGKQVYLGSYIEEDTAARAYDLAALKYWGPNTLTNFPVATYEKEIQRMQNATKEEYLASLKSYLGLSTYFGHRKNHGFSRGISKHQGVTRPPHSSRCEARVGRVFRNKYLHLGAWTDGDPEISSVANTEYTKWLKQQESASCLHSSDTEHYNFAEFRTVYFSNFAIGEGKPILLQDLPSRSGSSGKTSRSALSLLLRSSMYKKLVENNSNEPDAKIKEEDMKDGMRSYENINRH